jgi:histidinol-phosphate/aromatic aminotransferase/cobyric acid decarboxylase-like protein
VLYPAISYPTYAMGATSPVCDRCRSPNDVDGRLDLASIKPDDVARALVLWANSPSNPTGFLDDLEAVADLGSRTRRAGRE